MELARTKIIACVTVIEETLPLLPPKVQTQTLDFGLHLRPDGLRRSLQEARAAYQQQAGHEPGTYYLTSQDFAPKPAQGEHDDKLPD